MENTKKKRPKKSARRMRLWLRIGIVVFIVLVALVGIWHWIAHTSYTYVDTVKKYAGESSADGQYIAYSNGLLEYGRDGIAMLTMEGEELWNQPCQMGNPIAETCDDTAVVADKGGTAIYVFRKNGLKGEIQTTRPIERIAVSGQGIVAAILQDEETPRVMCYDAKGNVLVEHAASLKNIGYPVDLSISQDGNTLLVSYLCTDGNSIYTKVRFYHFGESAESVKDHVVAEKEYADAIAPTVEFLDDDTSVLVLDNALVFYRGLKEPEEIAVVPLKQQIQSVAYNEEYVALVLKGKGKAEYDLCLYRTDGKLLMSTGFDGEYTNIKVADSQILLYEEGQCMIFHRNGTCKFRGVIEGGVADLYPLRGLNKYLMINAEGFEEIRLAK
ncbi:MAG: DUF5711 family protein [Faecalimonas sp.]|nr:DUF5711 family protein [Faecalimonas sp.]